MKLSQSRPNRRMSVQNDSVSPPTSRRPSVVYTAIITPTIGIDQKQKRPSITSITMLPRDSSSSLSASPPRSRSVTPRLVSHNLHRTKRPSLQEILSDKSPEPWTLQAFTAYCERNICLENLSFIQDAEKYADRYQEWDQLRKVVRDDGTRRQERKLINMWHNILHLYIQPGSSQEVNLPGDIRDELLSIPESDLPVDTEHLKPAVKSTHRLIEDSILFTFLNEALLEKTASEHVEPEPRVRTSEDRYAKARSMHIIPPEFDPQASMKAPMSASATYSKLFPKRSSQPSSRTIRPRTMFQWKDRSQSDSPSMDEVLRDDSSTGTKSPATSYARSYKTSATPPMSPPPELADLEEQMRPRAQSNSSWKKFGVKLGLKKSSSRNVMSPGPASPAESPFSS